MLRRASELGPNAPPPPIGSSTLFAHFKHPRVMRIYTTADIYQPITALATQPQIPLTVVIPAYDIIYLEDALRGLLLQQYTKMHVLIICADPYVQEAIIKIAQQYKAKLSLSLFFMRKKGWLSDALNAALANLTTEYFCRLDPDDVLHPYALQVMSEEIQNSPADYYYSCRFIMDKNRAVYPDILGHMTHREDHIWSGRVFPYSHLITYKASAVAEIGGFKSFDQYPNDSEWIAAYEMLIKEKTFRYVNAALYFKRLSPRQATNHENADEISYRKAMILQHWPDHYQEDYSE